MGSEKTGFKCYFDHLLLRCCWKNSYLSLRLLFDKIRIIRVLLDNTYLVTVTKEDLFFGLLSFSVFKEELLLDYFHFKRGLLMIVPCINKVTNHWYSSLLVYLLFPLWETIHKWKFGIRLLEPEASEPLGNWCEMQNSRMYLVRNVHFRKSLRRFKCLFSCEENWTRVDADPWFEE